MPEQYSIDEEFIIENVDTLKAVAHSLRLELLRSLKKPKTVKEVAAVINLPPTKLYYHINQLEKYGIIRVVETNIVSGIIEKTYQLTAKQFRVDQKMFLATEMTDETIDTFLRAIFDSTKAEIKRSVQAGLIDLREEKEAYKGGITRSAFRLHEEEAQEFYTKVITLFAEYHEVSKENEDKPDVQTHGLLFALYPVHTADEDEED